MIAGLKNKAVLITGAGTGIGAAAATAFAVNGARVMIHYNSSAAPAKRLAAAIIKKGGKAALVQGDVTKLEDIKRIVAETVKAFSRIDILINNAGDMGGRKPVCDMDDAHYDRVMRLNSWSVFAFIREVRPIMKAKGGGNIINVTSIAARNGGGGGAVLYAASKGFVSTLTRGMAKELVPDKIRVNAVAPGVILTPFHERHSSAAQIEAMRATIPMGYTGAPDECAGAFLFLASASLSGYVTGQIIEVNGGQLMP